MKSGTSEKSGRGLLLQFFCCILAGSLLTGCAFSRTPVKLSFSPSVTQPLSVARKGSLEIGEVKDTRLVSDPLVLMQKANQYGPTSGAYVAAVPVATIFRDGLKMALEQNGFVGTNAVHYELRAELQNFGIGVIQNGVFSAVTAKPWLEVRFELVDKANGQPVWHDTYTGQVTESFSSWTGEDGEFIAKVFPEVSQEVVKQLLSDRSFRNYFE
jgi:uncharacterized lipoprotein YajG